MGKKRQPERLVIARWSCSSCQWSGNFSYPESLPELERQQSLREGHSKLSPTCESPSISYAPVVA